MPIWRHFVRLVLYWPIRAIGRSTFLSSLQGDLVVKFLLFGLYWGLAFSWITIPALAQTPVPKRLILAGTNSPTTGQFHRDAGTLDDSPFNGTRIEFEGFGVTGNVNGCPFRETHSESRWERKWFEKGIERLRNTKSDKKSQSFLSMTANPGNVDWFDDAGWEQIVDHWRIAAWVAKEGGLRGILFDPEPYKKPFAQFRYNRQANRAKHTFDEYRIQARKRGQQIIEAVQKEFPDITLMTMFAHSYTSLSSPWQGPPTRISPVPRNALAVHHYGLYPAFIDGWLDKCGPQIKFVDGCEMSYYFTTEAEFHAAYVAMKRAALDVVAPENRAKYTAQVQAGFAIYTDVYIDKNENRFSLKLPPEKALEQLRNNVCWALRNTDEYVWVYGESGSWWPAPGEFKAWPSKPVQPHWEQKLPGIKNAFASGMAGVHFDRPSTLKDIALLAQNRGTKNLAVDGDFSNEESKSSWNYWQPEIIQEFKLAPVQGKVQWDAKIGDSSSGSLKLSQILEGVVLQEIAVSPGARYVISAKWRRKGSGEPMLNVGWKTAEGKWMHWKQRTPYVGKVAVADQSPDKTDSQQWQSLEMTISTPPGAGKMAVGLAVESQTKESDAIWFDDVKINELK